MSSVISIGDVIRRGVELRPHEAIALAQSVVAVCTDDAYLAHSVGPPTIETVHIAADGAVRCPGVARPSAFEIGLFLQSLLSHRTAVRVPGGLQYTIARALMEVEAPPFESVSQLSQVLKRHEQGDRAIIISELFDRAAAAMRVGSASVERTDDSDPRVAGAPGADAPVRVDRRRRMPQATTLRRQLREADRELFLQRVPRPNVEVAPAKQSNFSPSSHVRSPSP
jgi:hypothetical protein